MKTQIPEGWIGSVEIAQRMGFSTSWNAIKLCRSRGIEEYRHENPGGGHPLALFRRDEVEALIRERRHEQWLEAQGLKRCPTCGEWKDREHQYWGRNSQCIECAKETGRKDRQRNPRSRRSSTPAEDHPWRQSGIHVGAGSAGPVDEYVVEGGEVSAEDSLQYACMDWGFAVRPIPRGSNKRQAYCAKCEAARCIWHPEQTPEQIRKLAGVPTLYPERSVQSYVEGR